MHYHVMRDFGMLVALHLYYLHEMVRDVYSQSLRNAQCKGLCFSSRVQSLITSDNMSVTFTLSERLESCAAAYWCSEKPGYSNPSTGSSSTWIKTTPMGPELRSQHDTPYHHTTEADANGQTGTPQPIIPCPRTGKVWEGGSADQEFMEWIDFCHLRTERKQGWNSHLKRIFLAAEIERDSSQATKIEKG